MKIDFEKPIEMKCMKWPRTNLGDPISFTPDFCWRGVEFIKLLKKRDAALIWDHDDKDYPARMIEIRLENLRNC